MNSLDSHRKDTYEAICFCDFIRKRNFTYQGEEVNPTSKQLLEIQKVGSLFFLNADNPNLKSFDINSIPRILIANSILMEIEYSKLGIKKTRCHCFLFNDIIVMTKTRDNNRFTI